MMKPGLLLALALGAFFLQTSSTPPEKQEASDDSYFVATTGKAGLFSFAGAEHAIIATEFDTKVRFDPERPEAGSVTVIVPTEQLRIDTPRALKLGGKKGADPKDVPGIQKQMLGAENLDTEKYPEIRFESTAVQRKDKNTLAVRGKLTLHGVTREVELPVHYQSAGGGAYRFRGELKERFTHFNMEPHSVAGLVKVADEFRIQFAYVAEAKAGEGK